MQPGRFDDRIPDVVASPPTVDIEYADLEREEPLGRGGTADVYRATLARPDGELTVALKQPRFEGTISTPVVERFLSEAETWARLDDHGGVVGVLDWGSEPLPWIALEYMDGGPLSARVGDLDTPAAVWIGIRIASAVRHAHRHGVAHLDLKPTNVLFRETPEGCWDYPKVSDWGVARLMLEDTASVEALSPQYAAPEQFAEDEYGAPDDFTDIYQVGAVVYELVTGEPPFEGSAMAVMRDVLDTDPRPPTAVDPALPSALDEVLGTALAKAKTDRHESILDLRRALEDVLASLGDDAGGGGAATGAAAGRSAARSADADDAATGSGGGTGREGDDGATPGIAADDDGEPDDGRGAVAAGDDDGPAASDGIGRRRLLQGAAGTAVVAGVAGAVAFGTGGDNPSRNELGDGGDGGEPTTTGRATGVDYGDWFSNTASFEGTVDRRGRSRVGVAVGAEGNSGHLAFEPTAVRVDPGTEIVWEWTGEGGQHNVRAESGAYESPLTDAAGTEFGVRFDGSGVSRYSCVPHERVGMRGAVVVGDADGSTGSTPETTVLGTTPTSTTRSVRQAVLLPTTGALGDFGSAMRDAAVLPARELDDADLPLTVDLEMADTATDPSTAVSAAADLADAGYPAIAGPASSASALEVANEVFIPRGVVGCSPSATSPQITSLDDDDYVWRTIPSETSLARAMVRVSEAASAAVLAVDNSYGQSITEAFETAFDGTVQTTVTVQPGQSSYSTALSDALAGGPDTLVLVAFPNTGVTVLGDYYAEYDPERPILVPDGMRDDSLPREVGDDLSNVRGVHPAANGPGKEQFETAYTEAYGSEPGAFTHHSYDATAVLLLANVAAGANDSAAIRDAIPAVTGGSGATFGPGELAEAARTLADGDPVDYEGAASAVEFDANGDPDVWNYAVFGFDAEGTTDLDTVEVS